MRTFKDSTGKEWKISITIGSAKRVLANTPDHLDLFTMKDETDWERLTLNYSIIADAICELCRPEWEDRGLTSEQFFDILDGVTMGNAMGVFKAELADFFLSTDRRDLATMIHKSNSMMTKATTATAQRIEAINEDEQVAEMMKKLDVSLAGGN